VKIYKKLWQSKNWHIES